jgi:hypothetical protein
MTCLLLSSVKVEIEIVRPGLGSPLKDYLHVTEISTSRTISDCCDNLNHLTMTRTTKAKPLKKAKTVQVAPESEEEEQQEEEGYSSPSILETGDGGNIESDLDAGSDEESSVSVTLHHKRNFDC